MSIYYIIFSILALFIIAILVIQFITLNDLKKIIEENNATTKQLKNELDKLNLTEKDMKHQIKVIKSDHITLKQDVVNKETSALNQITSFSELNHDIRTQLNGIIAFSNILETEFTESGNKEFLEYASNIHICGENLLKLFS